MGLLLPVKYAISCYISYDLHLIQLIMLNIAGYLPLLLRIPVLVGV